MPGTLVLDPADDRTRLPFPEYVAAYVKSSSDLLSAIGEGLADYKAGRVRPWEEIKRELGLG